MSYTVNELRTLARNQHIKYIFHKSKEELCQLLNIPFEGENDSHKYLKTLRKKPRAITLTNHESNEEHTFKSIYKCAKYFNVNPGVFGMKMKRFSNWIMISEIKFIIAYP